MVRTTSRQESGKVREHFMNGERLRQTDYLGTAPSQ